MPPKKKGPTLFTQQWTNWHTTWHQQRTSNPTTSTQHSQAPVHMCHDSSPRNGQSHFHRHTQQHKKTPVLTTNYQLVMNTTPGPSMASMMIKHTFKTSEVHTVVLLKNWDLCVTTMYVEQSQTCWSTTQPSSSWSPLWIHWLTTLEGHPLPTTTNLHNTHYFPIQLFILDYLNLIKWCCNPSNCCQLPVQLHTVIPWTLEHFPLQHLQYCRWKSNTRSTDTKWARPCVMPFLPS
jgi:hypothetical protein